MATHSCSTVLVATTSTLLILIAPASDAYAAPYFEPETKLRQDEEMEFEPPYALLFPWVTQALGVVVFFLLYRFEIPIPYVAILFILGMFMGIGALRSGSNDQLTQSILQWSYLDSRVVLLAFLPGLIFRDAIEVSFDLFMVAFGQVLIFAFPMVLMGTFFTGLFAMYVLPYDWSWSLALTLGSILASTDPIAMASVLKKAEAPPRLKMHLNGESLLNDASAVVFFTIFSQNFLAELNIEGLGSEVGWSEGVAIFFRMSLGGMSVGVLFAMGLLLILYELDRRLEQENNVLQVAAAVTVAYLSYYVSEMQFQMSGIIACVTCGITSSAFGKGLINDPKMMDSYLSLLEHLLNTLLFALGGVVFGEIVANTDFRAHFLWEDWGYLILLYLSVEILRVVQVATMYPLVSRIGLKSNWREAAFFSYGGLRGAVGIALALSLDSSVREATTDEAHRAVTTKLVGMSGGVTLLTLMVNGSTAGFLLRKLGLAKPTISRKRVLKNFEAAAMKLVLVEEQKLLAEPRFSKVNPAIIKAHAHFPFLPKASQADVDEAKEAIQRDLETGYRAEENDETGDNHIESLVRLSGYTSCSNELLAEIRQIFLELLDAAYQTELATGQLSHQEDHGFNLGVLRESVAFAAADVRNPEVPVCDWRYTTMYRFRDDAEAFLRRSSLSTHIRDKRGCTSNYQQLRINVVRSIAFIEAHRLAEQKLSSYLNSALLESLGTTSEDAITVSEHLEDAIHTVLKESRTQVEEAEEMLKSLDPTDVSNITAHYLCIILLHRLSLHVEGGASEGILTQKEAQLYLDRIKRNVCHAHLCPSSHDSDQQQGATACVDTQLNG